jgi:predicted RNA binding protein YcfA (HicA-like mRNA interferase family)
MKLPRDCSGIELARALRHLGYDIRRQSGSHMQLTTQRGGEHHVTIPAHHPLRMGLLNSLLKDIAAHHHLSVDQLVIELGL